MKTRNDCEITCDCVKRANVVLHVGLCKEIFARKHTATHKPTSAQPHIVTTMTHIHTRITALRIRAYGIAVQELLLHKGLLFQKKTSFLPQTLFEAVPLSMNVNKKSRGTKLFSSIQIKLLCKNFYTGLIFVCALRYSKQDPFS